MDRRKSRSASIVFAAATLALALALVPVALAGKGGKNAAVSTGSISGPPVMVVDNNGNRSPNAGDSVTFNVTSTATYPFVRLTCSQNGSTVLQQTLGFFGGWMRTFYLGGLVWTGGAADCTAVLYAQAADGTVLPTEAAVSFPVGA